MRDCKKELLLYLVTDRAWLDGRTLEQQVESAIKGGATFVQLREKGLNDADFLAQARLVKRVTDFYHVPFLINDNVPVALECDADGVHVGQEDMVAGQVRRLLGPHKILGVSAHSVAEALLAQEQGADYLGAGAVFSTSTKTDVDLMSYETLREICTAVSIPVVAIGGIGAENMMQLAGSGINGVAVVSALLAQPDVQQAAEYLRALAERLVQG